MGIPTFESMLSVFADWMEFHGWRFVPELAIEDEIPVVVPSGLRFSKPAGWEFLCHDTPFLRIRERYESSTGNGPVLLILERIEE